MKAQILARSSNLHWHQQQRVQRQQQRALLQRSSCCKQQLAAYEWQQQQQQQQPCQQLQQLTRRAGLTLLLSAALAGTRPGRCSAQSQQVSPELLSAFQEALAASEFEAADAAWSKAIALSPGNAAAWSNRGTVRLQHGQWQAACDDLQAALRLEQPPSALLLNNLANAEGALGRWGDALQHYKAAADDVEVGAIALANYALAAFETGDEEGAVRAARQLLRRDPSFLDARAALTAFCWASGRRADAEEAWEELQQAEDGLGAALYGRASAVARVRHRWPPRATAALVAFLSLSSIGEAEGYDGQQHEYRFPAAA